MTDKKKGATLIARRSGSSGQAEVAAFECAETGHQVLANVLPTTISPFSGQPMTRLYAGRSAKMPATAFDGLKQVGKCANEACGLEFYASPTETAAFGTATTLHCTACATPFEIAGSEDEDEGGFDGAINFLDETGEGDNNSGDVTVDENGYYVDAEGNYCDADGNPSEEPVKAESGDGGNGGDSEDDDDDDDMEEASLAHVKVKIEHLTYDLAHARKDKRKAKLTRRLEAARARLVTLEAAGANETAGDANAAGLLLAMAFRAELADTVDDPDAVLGDLDAAIAAAGGDSAGVDPTDSLALFTAAQDAGGDEVATLISALDTDDYETALSNIGAALGPKLSTEVGAAWQAVMDLMGDDGTETAAARPRKGSSAPPAPPAVETVTAQPAATGQQPGAGGLQVETVHAEPNASLDVNVTAAMDFDELCD